MRQLQNRLQFQSVPLRPPPPLPLHALRRVNQRPVHIEQNGVASPLHPLTIATSRSWNNKTTWPTSPPLPTLPLRAPRTCATSISDQPRVKPVGDHELKYPATSHIDTEPLFTKLRNFGYGQRLAVPGHVPIREN